MPRGEMDMPQRVMGQDKARAWFWYPDDAMPRGKIKMDLPRQEKSLDKATPWWWFQDYARPQGKIEQVELSSPRKRKSLVMVPGLRNATKQDQHKMYSPRQVKDKAWWWNPDNPMPRVEKEIKQWLNRKWNKDGYYNMQVTLSLAWAGVFQRKTCLFVE